MDVELFARRRAGAPPPHLLTAASPELAGVLPALPLEWTSSGAAKLVWAKWVIPPALQGRLLSIRTEGSSTSVEPMNVRFDFITKGKHEAEVVYKPIFYRTGGKDFFALKVPKNAERCNIQLKFNKGAGHVKLTDFQAAYDDAP